MHDVLFSDLDRHTYKILLFVLFLFCFALSLFLFRLFVCFNFCFSRQNVGHSVSLAFIMRFKATRKWSIKASKLINKIFRASVN